MSQRQPRGVVPRDPESLAGARLWLAMAGLAGAYVVFGRLGLALAHYQSNATLIWPPTGLALAALVLFGRRLWPGVFVGALTVNLLVGAPILATVSIAVGNTLEAVVGVWLLERMRFDPGFARLRDVGLFALFGVVGCTLVSATVGVGSLWMNDGLEGAEPSLVWLIWWLGDVGGAALVGPVLLVASRGGPSWSSLGRRGESFVVAALAIASGVAAFSQLWAGTWVPLFLSFVPFPFLIWAGLRLGPRGAITIAALTGAIAVAGTATGGGPFSGEGMQESLLLLWAYLTVLGSAATILAAAVAERDHAEEARLRAESERMAIETQMERAQRLESLGVLAGGFAHDFNNLLLAIRGNAELARMDLEEGGRPADAAREIEHASERAADLCRQLLDYAGESVRRPEPVALAELVHDVRRLLASAIPEGVKVEVDVQEDLPEVLADATQLRQVLMNVILNAVEAVEGSGHVWVRLRVEDVDRETLVGTFLASEASPGRFVVLEVEDDGVGMSHETLTRVFDPFFTTKEHGRGLGMAAVTGIVRTHHGAVKVASELGEGSVLRVLLPYPAA